MSFDKWKMRCEIAKLPTVALRRAALEKLKINHSMPDAEDEGYYRKPITKKKLGADGKTNGQTEIIGWEAVAYFMERGILCGVIGDRDMAINEVKDEGLWSWVVSNPVELAVYRAVERGEPWPDLHVVTIDPHATSELTIGTEAHLDPIERIIGRNHNQPPEEPLSVQHSTGIDNAIAAALTKVTSEEEAAQAAGSMNRIAELRLKADKAGFAVYDPPYRQYKELHGLWTPMVNRAAVKEKSLKTAILTFREAERKRISAEQLKADQERIAQEEANARAADRAIAAGVPEEAPFVVDIPEPEPLAPVTPTYRAAGQRAAVIEVEKWFLDEVTDYDAVYKHFKNNPVLQQTLRTIATAAVKLGQVIPGTKTHKGLV